MSNKIRNASADEARDLAESSREESWAGKSIMKEIFLGKLNVAWLDPFPETPESDEFKAFYSKLSAFLEEHVDGAAIDAAGEYPPGVISGLAELGCFGMKIDKKYGGLGFNQAEYCKALELVSYYDGNLIALLSAHQSIGLPQPLKLFGTDEQKAKFLPRCAAGAVSAFALTEPDVGSDPARLATMLTRKENGDYVLNGTKLWITNGTMAELMIVMARHEDSGKISAVIVDMAMPGVSVGHRCTFMGLKALENGVIHFDNVEVPKDNLVLKEGAGLKIALITLNTGRLSLPAACVGSARNVTKAARQFAAERVQWGQPVGKHEAVTHMISDLAVNTYGIETLSHLANELSMREGYDIRLEAAASKEYCSVRNWELLDTCMQVRGGRGYETEESQKARGERAFGIERMMRDSRINKIFEGSSEIMHLFMAREALDTHLKVAGDFISPKTSLMQKLAALPAMGLFYATWYPMLWVSGIFTMFKYGRFGKNAKHLRYADNAARRLARNVFHGMVRHQAGLEYRQAFLFRAVDVAMEILVMTACITRAQKAVDNRAADAGQMVDMADMYGKNARRLIERKFYDMWANDDIKKYNFGLDVLDGKHAWVETDAPGLEDAVAPVADSAAAK